MHHSHASNPRITPIPLTLAAFGYLVSVPFLGELVLTLNLFLMPQGNLSGHGVKCLSNLPDYRSDADSIDKSLYLGQYSQYGSRNTAQVCLFHTAQGCVNV